ncbi:MAG: phosphatase PAP2 family protein [Eubacterium sp.]
MEILLHLQDLRTEILNKIMLIVTEFGAEVVMVAIICIMFWCINKKFAYKLGFIYFISGLLAQILKAVYAVPRPWIKYKSQGVTAVEAAKSGATGYSFPSGHTQGATALWGTFAYYAKKVWIQIVCFIIVAGVIFSRLYLGVHTPLDVCVGFIITILVIMAVTYLVDSKKIYRMNQTVLAAILLLIPLAMVVAGIAMLLSGKADEENLADYFKSAGAAFAFVFGWLIETNLIDFDERRGSIYIQIIKAVIGIGVVLVLKTGIKAIFGETLLVDFIRYAVVVFWVVCIYPFILKLAYNSYDKKKTMASDEEDINETKE